MQYIKHFQHSSVSQKRISEAYNLHSSPSSNRLGWLQSTDFCLTISVVVRTPACDCYTEGSSFDSRRRINICVQIFVSVCIVSMNLQKVCTYSVCLAVSLPQCLAWGWTALCALCLQYLFIIYFNLPKKRGVCLWHRSSRTDEPILFYCFKWLNSERSFLSMFDKNRFGLSKVTKCEIRNEHSRVCEWDIKWKDKLLSPDNKSVVYKSLYVDWISEISYIYWVWCFE